MGAVLQDVAELHAASVSSVSVSAPSSERTITYFDENEKLD